MGVTVGQFPQERRIRKSTSKIISIGRWLLDEDANGNLIVIDSTNEKSFILAKAD